MLLFLFINPMWDNEVQRIGKKKCTPLGYKLHGISDLLGFIAILTLFGTLVYLLYRVVTGTYQSGLLWLPGMSFLLALIGSILFQISWVLAHRKGFRYEPYSREATWIEDGQRCSYTAKDYSQDRMAQGKIIH